jgi:hypothetical protein
VRFQQAEDFISQQREVLGDRLEDLAGSTPRNPRNDGPVELRKLRPVGGTWLSRLSCRQALLDSGSDHLHDVAAAERDAFAHEFQRARVGRHLFSQLLEFSGACDKRGEVEAEGEFDLPCPALSRVALSVGAVAPDTRLPPTTRRKTPIPRSRLGTRYHNNDDARPDQIALMCETDNNQF